MRGKVQSIIIVIIVSRLLLFADCQTLPFSVLAVQEGDGDCLSFWTLCPILASNSLTAEFPGKLSPSVSDELPSLLLIPSLQIGLSGNPPWKYKI